MTLRRHTPLPRATAAPKRSQPLQRAARALPRAVRPLPRRSKAKDAYERELDALTPALIERSGGWCEFRITGICIARAAHRHHRKLRRQGGENDLYNVRHVCTPCHDHAHHAGDLAYANGWLVHEWDDPSTIEVIQGEAAA